MKINFLSWLYTNYFIQPLKLLNFNLQDFFPTRHLRIYFGTWSKNHWRTSSLRCTALCVHGGAMHCRSCTDSSSRPGNLCLAHFNPCFPEGSFEHLCSFNELHWKIVLWSRGSTRAEILSKLLHPGACINCSLPVFVILFSLAVVVVYAMSSDLTTAEDHTAFRGSDAAVVYF